MIRILLKNTQSLLLDDLVERCLDFTMLYVALGGHAFCNAQELVEREVALEQEPRQLLRNERLL